jgi:hypothetical protein
VIAKEEQLNNAEVHQPTDLLNVEMHSLLLVTQDVLQTHVIAKEEQLENVDLHQPTDQPNAEMHSLQIATKNVHL